jgi:hypothetical protein
MGRLQKEKRRPLTAEERTVLEQTARSHRQRAERVARAKAQIEYGAEAQERILRELRRPPEREDGTATGSLSTPQRALREAPDGLPEVSTFTILQTLHQAGYSWQETRKDQRSGIPSFGPGPLKPVG